MTENQKKQKEIWIIRHGQATHNPRAEAAKAAGCSHDEFLELMRQDDSLDAPLTDIGRAQAQQLRQSLQQQKQQQLSNQQKEMCYWKRQQIELVVSSPLSRAIETADLVFPPSTHSHSPSPQPHRVCYEGLREINGWLENAKRRSQRQLEQLFPHWNVRDHLITTTALPDGNDSNDDDEGHDVLWSPHELEATSECAERAYQALGEWLLETRPETRVMIVAHGGILRFFMNEHPHVVVKDERKQSKQERSVLARFDNCELRRYRIEWMSTNEEEEKQQQQRRTLVLTELDIESDGEQENEEEEENDNDSMNRTVAAAQT